MTAIDWLEKRYAEHGHPSDPGDEYQKVLTNIYKQVVWIDANLKGGCVIDPYFKIHFYEDEDAMAYKLRWEE